MDMGPDALILGIDLGGTKSAACVARPTGEILDRIAGPTPGEGDAVVAHLIDLARTLRDRASGPIVGVGVSAGAPADAKTGVVFDAPNLPAWGRGAAGLPLAAILSDALGGLPIGLENDADATALAEHRFGAGRGANTLAFLTIGTGIGAGLILDGRLHRGAFGAGGEVGHISVEPGGRACLCGLRGCLEAYASGPSITRIAVENGYAGPANGPAVADAAREGDGAARRAFAQAATMLGRGLTVLCMLLNPERIVLGTLAVHARDLLIPTIEETVRASTWPRLSACVEIVPAELGDRAQDLATVCAFLSHADAVSRA